MPRHAVKAVSAPVPGIIEGTYYLRIEGGGYLGNYDTYEAAMNAGSRFTRKHDIVVVMYAYVEDTPSISTWAMTHKFKGGKIVSVIRVIREGVRTLRRNE